MKRLWAGGLAADGEKVGPAPLQAGGPPIMASAMGRNRLRAAQWAVGVSGFTLLGDSREADDCFGRQKVLGTAQVVPTSRA